MKVVKVKWIDSTAGSGWESKEGFKMEPAYVLTYGFLIDESDKYISIVQSYSPGNDTNEEQVLNNVTIPRCAVLSMETIEEDDSAEIENNGEQSDGTNSIARPCKYHPDDEQFLRQLERVLDSHRINASPEFTGKVYCKEQVCGSKE